MAGKPTYKELEHRIKDLEKEFLEYKRVQEELQESKDLFEKVFTNQRDTILIVDDKKTPIIIDCNPVTTEMFGYDREEILGRTAEFLHLSKARFMKFQKSVIAQIAEVGFFEASDFQLKRKDGTVLSTDHTVMPITNAKGKYIGALGVVHDITEHKAAQETLQRREQELELKTKNLKEINTALNVLLKKREEDKEELEAKMLANIKELVGPYLNKLKNSPLKPELKVYLNLLEFNLNDIISPFLHNLNSKYSGLTPTEIQVASLVKDGRTTKEIADILNSSQRAIEFHRNSLRTKFGLRNTKTNLRTYLLSLY